MDENDSTNRFEKDDNLEKLGEFGLIERIAQITKSISNAGKRGSTRSTGIGDDCAVIHNDSKQATLITTDMLLEGRHFNRSWISPKDLGYKSLAVNLSDISAMGGKPQYALLSIGLSSDIKPDWLNEFFGETARLCKEHNIELIGGDTVKSSKIVINYTVLGSIEEKKVLLRSGAKPGDKIGLIGNIGEAGAGLRLLKESHDLDLPLHRHLINSHNRPPIFIGEANFLADKGFVQSMIDVSDGIRSDAHHIAKQSGVTLTIETDVLPFSEQLEEACRKFSWDVHELALTEGEDYALLFTFESENEKSLEQNFRKSFPNTDFSVIGSVEKGDADVRFLNHGRPMEIRDHGFDQFKSE